MQNQKCGAKTRSGEPCKNPAMHNNSGRCRMHGGKSRRGINHPNFKSGIYTKDLAAHHLSNYQELLALGDRLFRIDDETAVITVLTQQALSRMDDGESGAAWRQARSLLAEFVDIHNKSKPTDNDLQRQPEILAELSAIFNEQSMSYAARDEAARLADLKRKFVHDERRAQTEAHKVLTYEQTMLILSAVVAGFKQALERHLDQDTRTLILSDSQQVIDRVLSP